MVVSRFDVYSVKLDPTQGSEIKKTRPCIVISPDEMNVFKTIIIAPLTSKSFLAPTRIPLTFKGKQGLVVLDQIRTIDKTRLGKKLGHINTVTAQKICLTLEEMFTY